MDNADNPFRPPAAPVEIPQRPHTRRRLLIAAVVIAWFLICVSQSHRFTFAVPAAAVYGALLVCVGCLAFRAWRRRQARRDVDRPGG